MTSKPPETKGVTRNMKVSDPVSTGGGMISGFLNRKKSEEEDKVDEVESLTNKPKDPFTFDKFKSIWKNYAIQLKRSGRESLFATLNSGKLEMKDENTIVLSISNSVQLKELGSEKGALMDYLRSKLNNYEIQLETIMVEGEHKQMKTPVQSFKEMSAKNPNLNDLRERLDLDIEY